MSDEMKARSFRMTDEIAEKFRTICNDFPNQNVALQNLITAYEVQNASAVLTDRQILQIITAIFRLYRQHFCIR